MSSIPQIESLVSGSQALKSPTVRKQPANTTIAEVVFVPAPKLPGALFAAVEVFPGQFMVGFVPSVYSREDAAEIARLIVGPFVDVTDEVTR